MHYLANNHPLNIKIKGIADSLLHDGKLNKDEKLLCLLFSGKVSQFTSEVYNKSNSDSYISNHIRSQVVDNSYNRLTGQVYIGYSNRFDSRKVFTPNPLFGFSIVIPDTHLLFEVKAQFTLNSSSKNFSMKYKGEEKLANISNTVSYGIFYGYTVYNTFDLILQPKLGFLKEEHNLDFHGKGSKVVFSDFIYCIALSVSRQFIENNSLKHIGVELSLGYGSLDKYNKIPLKTPKITFKSQLFYRF